MVHILSGIKVLCLFNIDINIQTSPFIGKIYFHICKHQTMHTSLITFFEDLFHLSSTLYSFGNILKYLLFVLSMAILLLEQFAGFPELLFVFSALTPVYFLLLLGFCLVTTRKALPNLFHSTCEGPSAKIHSVSPSINAFSFQGFLRSKSCMMQNTPMPFLLVACFNVDI